MEDDMSSLRSFGPWFAYGLAAAVFGWRAAAIITLVVAVVLLGRRGARSDIFATTAVGFFAGLTVLAVIAPVGSFHRFIPALVPATLTIAALWSVAAGRPFTIDFAKRVAPREYWDTPLFLHVNMVLTMVWAASFAVSAVVMGGVLALAPRAAGWLILVQVAAFVMPMRISRWYPAVARDRALAG
jgi:hypothetical protein